VQQSHDLTWLNTLGARLGDAAGMQSIRRRRSLLWPGEGTLAEAQAAIANGEGVDIVLPASEHHALCVCLSIDASTRLEVADGADLIARMTALRGLADLNRLAPAVRRAGYRARLAGPPPVLSLMPS
jgi:hypothetical protein